MKYTYGDYQEFCQEKYLAFGTAESLIAYYGGMADFAEKFRTSDVALQYRLRESGLMRDAAAEQTLECLIEIRNVLRRVLAEMDAVPDDEMPKGVDFDPAIG